MPLIRNASSIGFGAWPTLGGGEIRSYGLRPSLHECGIWAFLKARESLVLASQNLFFHGLYNWPKDGD